MLGTVEGTLKNANPSPDTAFSGGTKVFGGPVCVYVTSSRVICPPDDGGGVLVTVKVALLLVAGPAALVTMQRKVAPLSDVDVAGVVYEEPVAPEMFEPFFCH